MSEFAKVAAKAAFADFANDLDRVKQLLHLIYIFREFASQEEETSAPARDLWEVAQKIRTDLPILSGSLLLYLCGRFDYFVKELVGSIVDGLVDEAKKFEELPEVLRKEYFARTLTINQSPNRFNYTAEAASALIVELADNLAGRNDNSPTMRVDAGAITITDSNMRPSTMADLFKRVGIANVWDTLGKQLPLRTYLGVATEADCKKAATTRLEDIMRERNKIAHPTTAGATLFPDAKAVEDTADYFRVLAQVLVDLAVAPR